MPTGSPTGSPGGSGSVQWWIVLTTFTNSSGQPGSGYMIVSGTQQDVYAKYGGPSVVLGPYATQADAQAAAKSKVGSGPGNISQLAPGQPQASVGSLGPNFENWLLRGGEVALGVVLVAVGLNALLKNPVGKVAKTAAPLAAL